MFDNDNQVDREELIDALINKGLDAFEWDSGGGTMHVCVPLVATFQNPPVINTLNTQLKYQLTEEIRIADSEVFLYISTNSLQTPCEIGVMGAYGTENKQFASTDWQTVGTLEEAVSKFEEFWKERDYWIKFYIEQKELN